MRDYIQQFSDKAIESLRNLPREEIAKAINIIQAAYERDGRIYVFGNGGSLAIATHWVGDFNKTVFDHHLDQHSRRFQAIRLPSTEAEITAWANDIGFEMVFVGPLRNYLQDSDVVIAISSSGNSPNVLRAVEFAKSQKVPVIGLSGFDGGKLKELADAKIHISTEKGDYFIVEGIHTVILHMIVKYFQNYFDHLAEKET